jgi:hypothetical protein
MESLDETPVLQRIAAACWSEEGVRSPAHLGGLAWDLNQHLNKLDEVTVWIWDEVAYSLEYGSSEGVPVIVASRRGELVDEVLDRLRGGVVVPDYDKLTRGALARRGFTCDGKPQMGLHARRLDAVDTPEVPDGFRVRGFRPGDLDARVEAQRSAFAPPRVVPESYAQVQALAAYRPELDVVVEAADGRIAAFCLAWLDEENRAGELEPPCRGDGIADDRDGKVGPGSARLDRSHHARGLPPPRAGPRGLHRGPATAPGSRSRGLHRRLGPGRTGGGALPLDRLRARRGLASLPQGMFDAC